MGSMSAWLRKRAETVKVQIASLMTKAELWWTEREHAFRSGFEGNSSQKTGSGEQDHRAKANSGVFRWLRRIGLALAGVLALGVIGIAALALLDGGQSSSNASQNPYAFSSGVGGNMPNPLQGMTIIAMLGGFAVGASIVLLLAFWRFLIEKHGWAVVLGLAVLLVIIGETSNDMSVSSAASMFAFFFGFIAGISVAAKFFLSVEPATEIPNIFGSSRWATMSDLRDWGLLGKLDEGDGLFLGEEKETGTPIVYRGDMHALTVAPTRTGKGATAIIPNLLRSSGSVLVIDPKGENARRTVEKRKAMGQDVHVVDPWAIATNPDRYGPGVGEELLAHFNPLDALDPNDPDLATDAMMLADALVVSSEREPFWTDEAKALIYGFILYVVTDPLEEGQRTLARVRDILCLPAASEIDEEHLPGSLDEIMLNMAGSAHPLVRASAFRLEQKAEKERASVISSAQANTHFLDSPAIRESLSRSDFDFKSLKTTETGATVYLVLPLDRLPSFNRWLRLLITSAMIDLTRTPIREESEPVRVILDEFASLEKLTSIETAFGTMAGLGVQLWVITQDFSQLQRLYGEKGWQTFVSNSGVFQYFGSRDYETAKYAEHLTGMTTMRKRSISFGNSTNSGAGGGGSGTSKNVSYDDVQRPLAYADEMMTLHRDLQVLFVENRYPIVAKKHWWFEGYSNTL